MRKEDYLAALVGDLRNGRDNALNAGRVGNATALHRHVEIDAQQHALVGDVSLIESTKAGHAWRHINEGSLMWIGVGLVSASDLIFRPLRENAKAKPKIASTINPYTTQTMTRAYCLLLELRSASPSRPRYRPCGWRSPTRCHTTTAPPPLCRPSLLSGPCERPTNAGRD